MEDLTSELAFNNFEDLERTIYIFENFTNHKLKAIMEKKDKSEKLQTLLCMNQIDILDKAEHTLQTEAEITTITEL